MARGLTASVKSELQNTSLVAPIYCLRVQRLSGGIYLRWSEKSVTFDDGAGSDRTYEPRILDISGFDYSADEAGPITITLSNVDGAITTLDRAESFAGSKADLIAYLPSLNKYYVVWSGWCNDLGELTQRYAVLEAFPVTSNPHVHIPQRSVGIPCSNVFGFTNTWVSSKDFEGSECPYRRVSTVGFASTLNAGIGTGDTAFRVDWAAGDVTAGAELKKGHSIKIDSEIMLIDTTPAWVGNSQDITVLRAQRGTTAATHSIGATVLFASCFFDTEDCKRHGMYGNNSADTYSGGARKRNYFTGFPFVSGWQFGNYRSKSGEKPKPMRLVFSGNESAYGRILPLVYGKVRINDPVLLLVKPEGDFLTTLWAVAEGVLATNTTDDDQTTPSNAYVKTSGVENIYVNGVSRHDPRPGYGIESYNGVQDQPEPSSAFITGIADFSTNYLGFWGTARVLFRINTKNNPSVDLQGQTVTGAFEVAFGRVVRVYTDPSTFTRKATTVPAWVGMDVMTAKRAGGGLDHARLNRQSFIDLASHCNATVTSTFDGTTVPRWTFNGILDIRKSYVEWLHLIFLGCYCLPPFVDKDGLLKVKALKSESLSGLPEFSSTSATLTPRTYSQDVLLDAPVGYWRANESVGTSMADSSGNSITGTHQNTPTLGVTGALVGDTDKAIQYTGSSSEYTTMGDVASLSFTNSKFTIEFWANVPDPGAATFGILGKRGAGWEYTIHREASDPYVDFRGYHSGGADKYHNPIPIASVADGNWHHWVFTADDVNSYVYKDGVLISTVARKSATAMSNTTDPFEIGRAGSGVGTYYLTGSIDEIAVYNYRLMDDRILSHAKTGQGQFQVIASRNILWENDHSTLVKQRRPVSEIPNEIRVNYVDKTDYARVSLTVADRLSQIDLGIKLGDNSRRAIVKVIDLPGTSTLDEAARIATLILRAGEFGQGGLSNNLKVTFRTFYRDAEDLEIGDIIKVTDDLLNPANGEEFFRVSAISNEPMPVEGGGIVFGKTIEAVLHANAIYDDTALTVSKYDRIDGPIPTDGEVPAVTGFGVNEVGQFDTNNKPMTHLQFSFTEPSPKHNFKCVALHVTEDDGGGNPNEGAWQYLGDLYNSGEFIRNFEITNTRRHFCAVSRALSGHAMDIGTKDSAGNFKYPRASAIIDGITDVLPAPGGIQIKVGSGLVFLQWDAYTGNDLKLFKHFRVYRNTVDVFGSATKISDLDGTLFIDTTVAPSTTYYYWIVGFSVLNVQGSVPGSVNTMSAANAGADTGMPDTPIIGTVRNLGSFNVSEYEWFVGVDRPGSPVNWGSVYKTELQISPDQTFATFPAGQSFDGTSSNSGLTGPPITIPFKVNIPGTYWFRARVLNSFGASGWTTPISRQTHSGDNTTNDTDLMPVPASLAIATQATRSDLAGNEFELSFEIPIAESGSYWGHAEYVHDSSTFPTATKFYDSVASGSSGSLNSGVSKLSSVTPSPGWGVNSLVGKDVVIFSPLRGGSPTWDYEGMVVMSKILANSADEISFELPAERQHRTLTGCKFFVVNSGAGHHVHEKVKFAGPVVVNEGVTALTDERSSRKRKIKFAAGIPTVYCWAVLSNLHGWGKLSASVSATFGGVTTNEIKLLAVTNGLIASGAVTSGKISVASLDAISVSAGTITAGTFIGTVFKTATSGQRIEIDSSNGLRLLDSGGNELVKIPLSGSLMRVVQIQPIGTGSTAGTYIGNGDFSNYMRLRDRFEVNLGGLVFEITTTAFRIVGSMNIEVVNGYGIQNASGNASIAFPSAQIQGYISSTERMRIDNTSSASLLPLWLYKNGALTQLSYDGSGFVKI